MIIYRESKSHCEMNWLISCKMQIFLILTGLSLVSSQTVPIGGDCNAHDDCYGQPNSKCDEVTEKCRCLDGWVGSLDKLECLEVRNDLGGDCAESPQCTQGDLGSRSLCERLKCACIPTAVHVPEALKDKCMLKANLVGDNCEFPPQCEAELGDDADCVGPDGAKVCECDRFESIPRFNKTKCLHKVEVLNGPCEEAGQCVLGLGQNTLCNVTSKTCTCTTNAIPIGNRCYLKAGLGERCDEDEQCKEVIGELSECSPSGVCMCNVDRAIPSHDGVRCLKLAKTLGEECEEIQQCTHGTPGSQSYCMENGETGVSTCQCTDDAIGVPGGDRCLPKANKVGEPCTINDQCRSRLGNLTFCERNICTCTPGNVEASDKSRCLPGDIPIGDPCEDPAQCLGGGVCTPSGYCDCPLKTVPREDKRGCLPVVDELGLPCDEAAQCQQGDPGPWSDCVEKFVPGGEDTVCSCIPEAITGPGSHECLKVAEFVGDPCKINGQCHLSLDRAQCVGGTCICLSDSSPTTDLRKCVVKSSLNQPCEDNGQCSHIQPIGSAGCLPIQPGNPEGGSSCQCNPGFSLSPVNPGMCMPLAQFIGDPCNTDGTQCDNVRGTICSVNKTCVCDPTRETIVNPERTKCLDVVHSLGSPCEENLQCLPPNSDCIGNGTIGLCTCRLGEYVESLRTPGVCIKLASGLNDTCSENIQCTNSMSECRYGLCRCSPNYGEWGGQCYSRSVLGGYCTTHEECFVGVSPHSFCNLNKCYCRGDAIELKNNCWERKIFGSDCISTQECSVGMGPDSYCNVYISKCDCLPPTGPSVDQKTCSGSTSPHLLPFLITFLFINFILKAFL